MATKIHKQIYLEPNQELILKRLAKKAGVTEAEIIRQAINRQIQKLWLRKRDITAWEKERAFITKLILKGPVPRERTCRRELLYGRKGCCRP